MGNDTDRGAVLDSKFRVRGTRNLRVVDASSFPWMFGFFISVPLYMLSEKAFDIVLQDSTSLFC
jgi:choline dehydrogenase